MALHLVPLFFAWPLKVTLIPLHTHHWQLVQHIACLDCDKLNRIKQLRQLLRLFIQELLHLALKLVRALLGRLQVLVPVVDVFLKQVVQLLQVDTNLSFVVIHVTCQQTFPRLFAVTLAL